MSEYASDNTSMCYNCCWLLSPCNLIKTLCNSFVQLQVTFTTGYNYINKIFHPGINFMFRDFIPAFHLPFTAVYLTQVIMKLNLHRRKKMFRQFSASH